jgi:antitoxin (DNA-binding transcriptional repressor) of toxin-antitoxin stability system
VITVHGEPAAELRPIEKGARKQTLAERIAELESRGEISFAKRKQKGAPEIPQVARRPGALKRFLNDRDE